MTRNETRPWLGPSAENEHGCVTEIERPEVVWSMFYFHLRVNSRKEDLLRGFNSVGSSGVNGAWDNRTTAVLCTWVVLPARGL